jgi:hypothetical protein
VGLAGDIQGLAQQDLRLLEIEDGQELGQARLENAEAVKPLLKHAYEEMGECLAWKHGCGRI